MRAYPLLIRQTGVEESVLVGRQACVWWKVAAVLLCAALSLSWPRPLQATGGRVLVVCPRGCPFSTVNSALATSSYGDVVAVGPGVYLEYITLRAGVTIRGEGRHVSIITGADANTVVRAYGASIDRNTVLEGVTIISGRAFNGAGIDIRGGASPTIRNNLITANTAGPLQASYGGGIFVSGGSPLISGNRFSKNYAASGGGAIAIWDESSAVISNNIFEDNRAFEYGGAINVTRASPLITGNTVISNTAYYGGGLYMAEGSPQLTNNLILGNVATTNGGGVFQRGGTSPVIFANTFMTNTAYYYGGGLYIERSPAPVTSNSFHFNIADSGAGVYVDRSAPLLARNSIQRNAAAYLGGGVLLHNAASTVDSNSIYYNTAIVGGGGIGVSGHSTALVINNVVADNAVGVYGGAVYIEGSAPSLINNLLARNSSSSIGGGVYVDNATPLIRNNTITGNNLAGNGEGIYLSAQGFATITNNIIIDNGFGIFSRTSYVGLADAPLILRNNVWNNRYGNFEGLSVGDNIGQDPLFMRGRDGAFYLSQVAAGQDANSPSVDSGHGYASDNGLDDRTTAVHDLPDEGIVDMGYHYRALYYKAYASLIISDRQ